MTTRDEKVSAKTVAIRLAAGNPGTHCPLCGRTAAAPYRRSFDGALTEGCVDAFHTGHLYGTSNQWHTRDTAKALRASALASLLAR